MSLIKKVIYYAIIIFIFVLVCCSLILITTLWLITNALYYKNIERLGNCIFDSADNILDYLKSKLC